MLVENNESCAWFSAPGAKHHNQDSVFAGLLPNSAALLVVADGMGGQEGGKVASSIAVKTVVELLLANPALDLKDVFQKVYDQLMAEAATANELSRMGTTLTVCLVISGTAYVGHVGDSRAYVLRRNGLKTLTKDQTEVQRLIDDGILNEKEAKKYPRRNILLSVLAPNVKYTLQKVKFPLEENDRILLVTDGLYNVLSKVEIRDFSIAAASIYDFCECLRQAATLKVPKDDFSAVCFEFTGSIC